MSALLALFAAVLFSLGTVLQQRGGLRTPGGASDLDFWALVVRSPAWLAGTACQACGGVLHLVALRHGEVVLVEPILMLSVVFCLPFGAWLTAQRVGWREVRASLVVVVGLVIFLLVGRPQGGVDDPPLRSWIAAGGVVVAIAVITARRSRARPAEKTAGLLGTAAGAMLGLDAAVAKLWTNQWGGGIAGLVSHWSTYALAATALSGGALQQGALNTGALAPAMATVHVTQLGVSVGLGLWVFQEQLARGHGALALCAAGLWLAALGVITLTTATARPRPVTAAGQRS